MTIMLTDAERTFADSHKGITFVANKQRARVAQSQYSEYPQPWTAEDTAAAIREGAAMYARFGLQEAASATNLADAKRVRDTVAMLRYT